MSLSLNTEILSKEHLPPFLRDIITQFNSKRTNYFLLTGNVDDLIDGAGIICPITEVGLSRYRTVEQVITERLSKQYRIVITYDTANGIRFNSTTSKERVKKIYANAQNVHPDFAESIGKVDTRGQHFERTLRESRAFTLISLKFLDELFRIFATNRNLNVQAGVTLIIRHTQTLVPDAALTSMSDADRQKLTVLIDWLSRPEFIHSDDRILFIAPTTASVHSSIRSLPYLSMIQIPRPGVEERKHYLYALHAHDVTDKSVEDLAQLTAGMSLINLKMLVSQARYSGQKLSEKDIIESLNQILLSELGDKIEIVKPQHTMEHVVGASALKNELLRVSSLIGTREPNVIPTGILVSGPNGVGKTFVFEAWAQEQNWIVVILKNLRGMYFGETDQIFEKIRSVLEVLGKVMIIVDEADTVFGKPDSNTHETEARLFGAVIKMMSEPKNRGKIMWILITARPHRLAPDLKRSGRAGLKLSIFDPECEDRVEYVRMILGRCKFKIDELPHDQFNQFLTNTAHLSPADFNELMADLLAERCLTGHDLTVEKALEVVRALRTSTISDQRRYQTLQALKECSRQSLVPESLRRLTPEQIEQELRELEVKIGN